jgi:murein DD-endopeptidase MepM/ murein hydrolase activator NlpD
MPVGSIATPTLSTLQKKIEATQGKIGRKKGTERVLTTQISAYSTRINRLQGKITTLSTRQARLQADLDRKRAELVATQSALRSERARLVRLRTRLNVARHTLADRLVELYTADRPDLVTVVLNAKGFADLLEREEFLSRINSQDREVIRLVRDAKADAASTAKRLDVLERRQQRVAAAVLQRRDELAGVRNELIGTRVGYQRTRNGKAAALGKVREDRHGLEENLAAMERQSAQIQQQLQGFSGSYTTRQAGPIQQGSGSMIWPVSGPITGAFGEQRPGHIHAGIDIAAPEGTPIRAADDGRVALMQGVGASGGYGNYTCIQHSGSLATCYAHQSRFATSIGANVSKGDIIGYVGNTGHSFGAHLHFEVRINGVPTSPLAYL